MFQIQERTFIRKNDGILNLKQLGILEGCSLYHPQSKPYLYPDSHGNVLVEKERKYMIRKPFLSFGKEDNQQKKEGKIPPCGERNPFIQFCEEYRRNHLNKRVKVETISEAWKQLDDQTRRERYGCKIASNPKEEEKSLTTNNTATKRKGNENDDDELSIKEEKTNVLNNKKLKKGTEKQKTQKRHKG